MSHTARALDPGGPDVAEQPEGPRIDLAGTWRKKNAPACADKYPDALAFSTGTYRGTRGEQQGFIWVDAGIYRMEGERRLLSARPTMNWWPTRSGSTGTSWPSRTPTAAAFPTGAPGRPAERETPGRGPNMSGCMEPSASDPKPTSATQLPPGITRTIPPVLRPDVPLAEPVAIEASPKVNRRGRPRTPARRRSRARAHPGPRRPALPGWKFCFPGLRGGCYALTFQPGFIPLFGFRGTLRVDQWLPTEGPTTSS